MAEAPDSAAISNRMSAAGISMFYAAFDMATARAEVSANISTGEHILTGAEWTNTRELNVLDLTKLPAVPSIYATPRHERDSAPPQNLWVSSSLMNSKAF